jgi:hypothetical protein
MPSFLGPNGYVAIGAIAKDLGAKTGALVIEAKMGIVPGEKYLPMPPKTVDLKLDGEWQHMELAGEKIPMQGPFEVPHGFQIHIGVHSSGCVVVIGLPEGTGTFSENISWR